MKLNNFSKMLIVVMMLIYSGFIMTYKYGYRIFHPNTEIDESREVGGQHLYHK